MSVRERRLTLTLLAGILVILIAGSTAALAISRHQHDIAGSASQSATGRGVLPGSRMGKTTSGSSTGSRQSASAPAGSGSQTAIPGAADASSAAAQAYPETAPAGPSNNLSVQMSPSVQADARSADVQQLLQGYFDSINQHNYAGWTQLVTSSIANRQTSAQWLQAYATTVDSSIWMQSMADDPLQVKLRFTSQQDPDLAPKDLQVDCINWTLTYQVATQGGRLLVGSTVPGSVSYTKCT